MKRFLALILASIFLLASCTNGESNVSETSGETEESNMIDEGVKYTLVSVGKKYTTTASANESYPDKYNQQLTDGQKVPDIGAHYVDSRMVGYTEYCVFQIDLGEDGKRISAIAARCLEMYQDGVLPAASAQFAVSNDGSKFETLGRVFFEEGGNLTVSTARYELPEDKIGDYRYVRVTIAPKSGAHFFFVDEIEVFADVPEKEAKPETVDSAYENENIDRTAWRELSTGKTAAPVDYSNIALGAKYSFDGCTFDGRAPISESFLTDGARTNRMFSEPVWVGINGTDGGKINLNLENKYNNIYSIRIHALGSGIDVSYPDYIDVFAAKDGENYTFLGRMYAPAKSDNYAYTLLFSEYIEAKSFRFEFSGGGTNYWVEEIEILAGYNEETLKTLYPKLDLPVVGEELLWDTTETDYSQNKNLILGKEHQIAATYYASLPAGEHESTADSPLLTDGKRAESTYCYSGEYFVARGGEAVDIFYDLEKLSSVNKLTVSMIEQGEWGIAGPKFVNVYLSENGTDWHSVGHYEKEVSSQEFKRVFLEFDLGGYYAARFVRFRVESSIMFIDELEAFGKKEVNGNTKRLANSDYESTVYYTNSEAEQFATTENTPIKAEEIAIVYGNRGDTENLLLPFVAYLDADGNIKDTFMDGFLYCNSGTLPSGSQPHLDNYKQDWEYMYDITFNGKNGLNELEKTVAKVKEALGLTDYKVQVYFTFLTLRDSVTDFGDVDGDGVTEDLSTSGGRKKVIDWFMNKCETEFASRGYKNLEVGGYYWVNEAVTWEKDDSAIIKEVASYVHANGSQFLWVPYYKAYRFYTGYELGFDLVCMQPNVVFKSETPLWQFDSTIEMTKARKMCVEIEHTYQALSDPNFARSYMLYLYHGAKSGYMDAIHVYYDDIDNFATMAYSSSPLCRMQYDATYEFAKGTLDIQPEKLSTVTFNAEKNTVLRANLSNNNELVSFTLVSMPEHGYVSLSANGEFVYYPEKGYSGSDSFNFTYNEYLGESEICTVEITVE